MRAPDRAALPYLRVGLLLCPNFTLTPMASFVDALRLAADRADNSRQLYFAWDFVAAGPSPVRASCGLELIPKGTLDDPAAYDCLVVCGGLVRDLECVSSRTYDYLRAADARGIPIVGLCTGSFVLAKAGLLQNRRCALHFDTLSAFTSRFSDCKPVTNENYIVDGNVITSPGSIVAIDVAAFLIARYSDAGRARKSLNHLLFKPEDSRVFLKAKPYEEALGRASRLTANAVQLMEVRLDSPCSIATLAKSLNVSRASLSRAFATDLQTSPAAFWRNIRLLAARELLARRHPSVTEIAYQTGFSDTAHFCHSFKKNFSVTPQEYRRATGTTAALTPA